VKRCINNIQPSHTSSPGSLRACGPVAGETRDKRFREEVRFEAGYVMVVERHTRDRDMRLPFDQDQAPVSFCYNLSQRARCTVLNNGKSQKTFERKAGDGVLAYLPQIRGLLEAPQGENVLGISLYFPLEVFRELFGISGRRLAPLQAKPGGGPKEKGFYHQAEFEPDTRLVLWQILQCPYGGRVRRLFLEAKSLELVALKLAELEPTSRDQAMGLNKRAMDQVREAHQILVERMADPPSLTQLGLMVGLNRNKLNRGFKKLYGDTVFNVLRMARLAKASSLLQNTDLSLAEIAFAIGYNSQANFTTAFRQHFGQPPKKVRQKGLSRPGSEAVTLS